MDSNYDVSKGRIGTKSSSRQRPQHVCVKGGFDSHLHAYNTRKAYSRDAHFFVELSPQFDTRQRRALYVIANPIQGISVRYCMTYRTFLTGALDPKDRRAHERHLLQADLDSGYAQGGRQPLR